MFNDMRDNERRQASHGQRIDLSHASMSNSSAATRYPEAKQIVPSPELMAATSSVHVAPSLFRTAKAPRTAEALGVDSALLEQSGGAYWPSPPIESMNKTAWPLLLYWSCRSPCARAHIVSSFYLPFRVLTIFAPHHVAQASGPPRGCLSQGMGSQAGPAG